MTKKLEYQLEDGTTVPLFEGEYDMAFKVYKSHRKTAVIGHPLHCIEAKGLCKLKNVREAYIGSGKDAYVVFEQTPRRDYLHAVHFIIPVPSAKVRDSFEVRGAPATQTLLLRAPSNGQTLKYKRETNKKWREAVKNGKHVEQRGKINQTRISRIGVAHRPRAKVSRGVFTVPA